MRHARYLGGGLRPPSETSPRESVAPAKPALERTLARRLATALAAVALVASWLLVGVASGQSALDEQVRAIASGLRCPVCQNLSVADSPSEMAQQMRAVVRERLAAGQSREQIEAYFVAKYGQWVLLSPRRSGFNLVLWLGPFVGVVAGLLVAARFARRWARRRDGVAKEAADPAIVERVRAEAADDRAAAADPASASPLERERARLYEALRELAFDHRAGKLSAEDYEAMRAEYEARAAAVLLELDAAARRARTGGARPRAEKPAPSGAAPERARRRALRLAVGSAFLIVFGVAVGVFLTQGLRPRASSMDSITGDFLTGTGPGGMSPSLSFRGNGVERNLSEGEAALRRGDLPKAIEHLKSVLDVEPNNPIALSHLSIVLSRGGHAEAALATVERALQAAPDHPLALWASGLILYEARRDYAGAIQRWEALLRQRLAPADADDVARMVADARQQLAAAPGGAAAGAVPSTPAPDQRRRITGTVVLAEAAGRDAPAGGTLFVIARQGAGPGPPLAVKRIIAPKFPVTFTLGPEDVMVKGPEFAGTVTLIARLKRDGQVGAAERGDLEGVAPGPVAVGTTDARVTLDVVR